ncbi:PorP/SprF family type IX secretion system membrane protein [Mucilaginibacter myungsuensis]|uniref:Type IX secretion system membrane protein PorP/SprF n=1 Tax=Mucilaginibacter myungsuensis TaxID=649104 RepID=A0A929KYC4_9SPHI|nr:type IX secretion system membrane protein PorP/SprF [Mucilaginibacter myungsuensis]MBE9660870.1 type IX secretion system membrane protein PorP/SprF [Mucilaginibacter myungsuensis]MDN3600917.1 type IX secretion system membrane protein PorP/SprF [Mucilaginibacter myungsuensis]
MKKAIIVGLICIISALKASAQQDAAVTQYIFNGLYINPAYAGYKEDVYVQSYYRSQWVGLTGAPRNFAIAIDGTVNDNVGLGAMLTNDQIGAQTAVSGYLNYAYRIRVGQDEESRLAFGLAAGMMQLGIDGSKLHSVTQGDQAIPVGSQSLVLPDAHVGVYYANSNYFWGLSATNLLASLSNANSAANMLVPIPKPHVYLTAGTYIQMNNDMRFKPVFLIKDDMRGPTTMDLNAFLLFNERFNIGGFYRTSVKLYPKNNLQSDLTQRNSFGLIADIFISPSIRVGYSYDQSLNKVTSYNAGSHELSVGFYLNSRNGITRSSYRCYKF